MEIVLVQVSMEMRVDSGELMAVTTISLPLFLSHDLPKQYTPFPVLFRVRVNSGALTYTYGKRSHKNTSAHVHASGARASQAKKTSNPPASENLRCVSEI